MITLRLVWEVIITGLWPGHSLGSRCITIRLLFLVWLASFVFFLWLIWARATPKVVWILNMATTPKDRLNYLNLFQYIRTDINLVWDKLRQSSSSNFIVSVILDMVSRFKVSYIIYKVVIGLLDRVELYFKFVVHIGESFIFDIIY